MSTNLRTTPSASAGPPRRTAPFEQEPGYYPDAALWLYGNARLLGAKLVHVAGALGPASHGQAELDRIEQEAEKRILEGCVTVSGVHNPAHQRTAVVALRWGAPRVLVFSGGFFHHLGKDLDQEPFRAARLWRYKFDPRTDLVISRRAPDRLPTIALHNQTVDRLILRIISRQVPGLLFRDPDKPLFGGS